MTSIPKDCPYCDGVGELPGDPYSKYFPPCSMCNGTGINKDWDPSMEEDDDQEDFFCLLT